MSIFQKLQSWLQKPDDGLHHVTLDSLEWAEHDQTPYHIQWRAAAFPAQLSLNYFPAAPDLPVPITDLDRLANFYRKKLASQQGGILSVSLGRIEGIKVIDTLFKIPQHEQEGFIYVGSVTIPFKDCSYVIKLQSQEFTHIGERERVVEEGLHRDGLYDQRPWSQDPFDLELEGAHLMNRSEEARFDLFFPDHPLSQVRQLMGRVRASIQFSQEVLVRVPFAE